MADEFMVGDGRAGSLVQELASARPHFKTVHGTGHLEIFLIHFAYKFHLDFYEIG